MVMNESKQKKNPGRRSNKTQEISREQILDQAFALFAHQGIAGTTVAQIAGAAGVTSAMIHYYFSNREGLLDALVEERLAPGITHVWSAQNGETLADPRRLVTDMVDRLLDTVEQMPMLPLLWSREVLNAGGMLRTRILPLIPLEPYERLCDAIAQGQQTGAVNPGISPALVPTSIMGVVMLPLAAHAIGDGLPFSLPVDRATLRKHALALLLDGLRVGSVENQGRKAP